MKKKTTTDVNENVNAAEAAPKKKVTRTRKKTVKNTTETAETEKTPETPVDNITVETPIEKSVETKEEKPAEAPVEKPAEKVAEKVADKPVEKVTEKPVEKQIKKMPQNLIVRDFTDLVNMGGRIPMLSDQQIQSLSLEEATERNIILEAIIANVLDYDIVMSDTNIWLELLLGHTSSHSDPKVNARLMFERQLEFISKMMKKIGGKFMIMSETYEEVDRFATMQEPTNYKEADWEDETICLNAAARLAKRLMLCQQKENRLRIEGIGSESHHASFADPAIIRRTVELFAQGKKLLLLTNDASVAIRALGMCDDLQRTNNIDDKTWREVYEPQRPMVLTMDDLKLLDMYTRQYHFLLSAAGRSWMQDVKMRESAQIEKPLNLWLEGFRPGDRHESRSAQRERERKEQQERDRKEQERREQERKEQERLEQERREAEKAARREEQQRREAEKAARREEQQRREAEKAARREELRREEASEVAETTAIEAVPAVEATPAPSAEMMELINEGNQTKEPKKRANRRGGRRNNKPKAE